jgi:hypothetical protein
MPAEPLTVRFGAGDLLVGAYEARRGAEVVPSLVVMRGDGADVPGSGRHRGGTSEWHERDGRRPPWLSRWR